jgi:predicted phage terminase large subunit-like protein
VKRTSQISLPAEPVSRGWYDELAREGAQAVQQERASVQIIAATLKAGRAAFDDQRSQNGGQRSEEERQAAKEERRTRTLDSALEFGRTYLPHYFESEPADFHAALSKVLSGKFTDQEMIAWREKLGVEVQRGDPLLRLTAIEVARGFAKSTIANLCDSLRRICHGLDPYLILASDTSAQAGAQLEDIKDELELNEKICADFGPVKPAQGLWRRAELVQRADGRVTWREGQIITLTKVRVDAIGRGGKMRGRRYGAQRPTCFTGDDLDNDENVVTKEQRDKAWNWLMSAVIPAMDPKRGEVRVIGTTIHFDCVIARAERKTDDEGARLFTSIKFPAMRRALGAQASLPASKDKEQAGMPALQWLSNWPARFSVEKLLKIRSLLGPMKFGAEYMNDPRDPETQIFDPNRFTYYAPGEIGSEYRLQSGSSNAGKGPTKVGTLNARSLTRILYVDPSKGKKGKGRKKSDFSGFADLLAERANRISYLLNAFRERLTPTAAKNRIVNWFIEARKAGWYCELWIEANSFGDMLGESFQDELRQRGVDVTVNTLLHTEEKSARLERHSIRVETGGVRFPNKWEREDRRPEWFSEYEDFPAGAYDDTIDAIESADHIAMELSGGKVDFASSGRKLGSALARGY